MQGYIYVLSNESMPGILKIGRSTRSGKNRATELYRSNTGVATPFELEFEVLTEEMELAESTIHECLNKQRVNESREFFKIGLTEAVFCVIRESVCGDFGFYVCTEEEYVDPSVPCWLINATRTPPEEFGNVIAEIKDREYMNLYSRMIARRAIKKAGKG